MDTQTSRQLLQSVTCLILVAVLTSGMVGRASAATVIYVKWDASGANSGSSWADAYKDLQSALASAVSGNQIWVAAGTYTPGSLRTDTFTLRSGVAIYGGFAGTESALSQRNWTANVTTLSGEIGSAGSTAKSYHVVTGGGAESTAVLDGLTITGGETDDTGAGMYNAYSSPTLANLTFFNNRTYAWGLGTGMYSNHSSSTLTNLMFTGTYSYNAGGGMYNESSSPIFTNVTFSANTASNGYSGMGAGGGMYNDSTSSPLLTNVVFDGNRALSGYSQMAGPSMGGGMYNAGNPVLTNVTFSNNTAVVGTGAGIYNEGSPVLTDVTFSGNASEHGAAIDNSGRPSIFNSVFWNDGSAEISNATDSTSRIANSIVQGGCPAGSTCTNISAADPKLGSLRNNGGFTRTMALGAGSAAIDKGNKVTCAPTDQRGVRHPQGSGCDIGAYEVRAMSFVSRPSQDGWVRESGQGTGTGGSLNSTGPGLRIGDDAYNRQYRSFVSFDTSPLPNTAAIVLAKLRLKSTGVITGTNPFITHGKLVLDLARPAFGSGPGLVISDFQAFAAVSPAGNIGPRLSSGFHAGLLNLRGVANINRYGTTQLRLRFSLSNNNDCGADYLTIYSSDVAVAAYRPTLIVYYNP